MTARANIFARPFRTICLVTLWLLFAIIIAGWVAGDRKVIGISQQTNWHSVYLYETGGRFGFRWGAYRHRLIPGYEVISPGRHIEWSETHSIFHGQWLDFELDHTAFPNVYVTSLIVPCWLPVILLAIFLLNPRRYLRDARIRRRSRSGQCIHCGYDLRASPQNCPECGNPVVIAPKKRITNRALVFVGWTCLAILIGTELESWPINREPPNQESRVLRVATLPSDPAAAILAYAPAGWKLIEDRIAEEPTFRPRGSGHVMTFQSPTVIPATRISFGRTRPPQYTAVTIWIMPTDYNDGGSPTTWPSGPYGIHALVGIIPPLIAITPQSRVYISNEHLPGWLDAAGDVLRGLFPEAR